MAHNNRNWNNPQNNNRYSRNNNDYNNDRKRDYGWNQKEYDSANYRQSPYSRGYGNRAGSYSSDYGYTNDMSRRGRYNDYNRLNSNRSYANIGTYGGGSFGGGYGSNYNYDRGSHQQDSYGNRNYGRGNEYDRRYESRNYRNRDNTSAGYDSNYERRYHNERYGNEDSHYNNSRHHQAGVRNIYGGDTSNYGNANQGGYDHDWWNRTRNTIASWFGDNDAEQRNSDRQNTGQYRGKGHKNYHRSEDRIREDVCDRLSDDGYLDATDIEVQVQSDDIILTGTVNDRNQKRRAANIAESVSGVRNVENRIWIRQ